MRRAIVFEEHASVLPHWVGRGVRDATVVCLDAHLDLQFIEPARIARLRACRSAGEVARLESAHPLSPRRDSCYGIEDFLCAAAQMGVLRRLVWVAPPHVLASLDYALAALRQMEGVTPQQLASFRRRPDGGIEGELLGVPLVALEWQHLAGLRWEGPVVLDIDADYFFDVPRERIWVQPLAIVTALHDSFPDVEELGISRSVGTGFLPLRHRFLGDQLAALWEARGEEAAHWQRLLDIDTAASPEPAKAAALRGLLAGRPGCAVTCHALARVTPDPAERAELLARAAALDPHYGSDLLRQLGALRARPGELDLATVSLLQGQLARRDDDSERAAAAWVALGLLHAQFGRLADAIACDRRSLRHGTGHPDLALRIGRLHMAAGDPAGAEPWLERAAADDETRAAAWLHLSVCASRRGALEQAWNWAQAAHEAAPAWPEAGRWLESLAAPPGYHWASSARSSVG
jgi:tetratricopeptide (TPR) repeat protein